MSAEPAPVVASLADWRTARAMLRPVDDAAPEWDDVLAMAAATRQDGHLRRWHASVPQRFHQADLADFATEAWLPAVADWANAPQGRNLVVFGPVGTGKTHLACAAVRPAVWRALDVAFVPVVELLDQLRPGGPEGALDVLADADRLVLDDLGSEKPTDWTAERLYALVNRRWSDAAPLVATTNLQPEQLQAHLGERTYSRLVGGAVAVRLGGQDRRRVKR